MKNLIKAIVLCFFISGLGLCAAALADAPEAPKPQIQAAMKDLQDQNPDVRFEGARRLEGFGPHALAAVPALIVALNDDDEDVRDEVVSALAAAGPAGEDFLIRALTYENPRVRLGAIAVLEELGKEKTADERMRRPTDPALLGALKDPNAQVRLKAIGCLTTFRATAAIPAFIQLLSDDRDEEVRSAALAAMPNFGSDAKQAIPAIVKVMQSDKGKLRELSWHVLMAMGADASPTFLELLRDKDDAGLRANAAFALSQIEPKPRTAVAPLMAALKDEAVDVREAAADGLGEFGMAAKLAVPALLACLWDKAASVRVAAVGALQKIDPDRCAGVDVLIELLEDKHEHIRFAATSTLAYFGPKAKIGVPALLKLLEVKDLHRQALKSLMAIELTAAPVVLPALLRLVNNPDPELRALAVQSLGTLGSEARPAIKAMTELLQDPQPQVRKVAAGALEALGPVAELAIPALTKALGDCTPSVRVAAAETLHGLDPDNRALVPVLVGVLQDREARLNAMYLLGRCGAEAQMAVPGIIQALKPPAPAPSSLQAFEDRHFREVAAMTVERLGAVAKAAVPVLVANLRDPDWHTRLSAVRALRAIGPEASAALPALREARKDRKEAVRLLVTQAIERIQASPAVPKPAD